jgi:alkylated DNA nucleotide flippase Atl1
MKSEIEKIKSNLTSCKNQWRWLASIEICKIPEGVLVTYGCIANQVNNKHGLNIQARNIAWLRAYLYGLLRHETKVPLHRIARKGDYLSEYDSEETRKVNTIKRNQENSYNNESWWCFEN